MTAITTNYSGAPSVGRAELTTHVRRVGRSVSFVHVELVQEDTVMCEALVTLGTIRDGVAVRYLDAAPPALAPLDECIRRTVVEEIKLMQVVDFRLDPSSAAWLEGAVASKGEVRGWLRLDDGASQWDAWSLLFASDSLPPATFPLGSSGWVPTLQLTYVRARGADGGVAEGPSVVHHHQRRPRRGARRAVRFDATSSWRRRVNSRSFAFPPAINDAPGRASSTTAHSSFARRLTIPS